MERRNPGDPARPNWKPRKDSSLVHGWIRIGKYNFKKSVGASPTAIPKTLENKLFRHVGQARGLDSTGNPGDLNRKLFLKEQKKLDPKKTSNRLFAELLALKFNIASSQLAKTPAGLGELIFDREGSPVDEMAVKEIAAMADTMMTYWRGRGASEYDSIWSAIYDVNRAFPGPPDTVAFMSGNLVLKGSVELSSVPFLKAPEPFVPHVRMPTSTATEPDEEFGEEEYEEEGGSYPAAAVLYQNYPNPFNPTTTIAFRLAEASVVTVEVYNVLGQAVATATQDEEFPEGYNEVEFEAAGLSSGVYFYTVVGQGLEGGVPFALVRRLVLLK